MMLAVHLRPEAEQDVEEAASWDEKQSDGLGKEFPDEVLVTLDRLAALPSLHPIIHRNTQRPLTHRFHSVFITELKVNRSL
jgi:hypothetical protein